eukprot:348306_1
MGACCNASGTAEERMANEQINSNMKAEINNQSYIHKILLLGPGSAGKTTIVKQMKKVHGDHKHNLIESGFGTYIKEKIMNYMRILCVQSIKLNIELNEEKNEENRSWFNKLQAPYSNHLNNE